MDFNNNEIKEKIIILYIAKPLSQSKYIEKLVRKGPFLITCGFANQGKSLVMFSFPIPLFLKKDLSFLHFKVWRYVFFLVA